MTRPTASISAATTPRWEGHTEIGELVIATPCYGGMITARYLASAIGTAELLTQKGVPYLWMTTEGESLIQRARNNIAAQFMTRPNATHLLFVDADIQWQPTDVIRLLCHDVDVICGLYPKKAYPIEYAFHPEPGAVQDARTGRIEIANAATGFLLIKRGVFERLAASGAVAKIERSDRLAGDELRWLWNFFPVEVEDGILWSEDYGFCRRWRGIGGHVWADPAVKLNHVGTHCFEGDPRQLLVEKRT